MIIDNIAFLKNVMKPSVSYQYHLQTYKIPSRKTWKEMAFQLEASYLVWQDSPRAASQLSALIEENKKNLYISI